MNRRAFGRALAALAASIAPVASTLGARTALAGQLTPAERETLLRGGSVRRKVDADLDEGKYIGGVAYAVVNAPAPFVLAMLHRVPVYKSILALTLEASDAGKKGGDQLVYFKHGGKLGTASYTMRIRPADRDGVVRFWMDPAFDHEIEDVWGYTRVEALGPEQCLATYAVLCDLGTVVRLLFGERIRSFALDTPEHIKSVAERDHAAARAAFSGGEKGTDESVPATAPAALPSR